MATTTTPAATKPAKLRKPPVAAYKRISDQLKRAAVGSKISKEELGHISALAKSLETFVSE